MDDKEKDRKDEWPDDDKLIFIPDEEYHSFMQSFFKMEQAQQELQKIKNGEWRVEN
jgi:hypothetical protein